MLLFANSIQSPSDLAEEAALSRGKMPIAIKIFERKQMRPFAMPWLDLAIFPRTRLSPPSSTQRKNSEVRALVTEDPVKARRLSEKYDIPLFYSYEELTSA